MNVSVAFILAFVSPHILISNRLILCRVAGERAGGDSSSYWGKDRVHVDKGFQTYGPGAKTSPLDEFFFFFKYILNLTFHVKHFLKIKLYLIKYE